MKEDETRAKKQSRCLLLTVTRRASRYLIFLIFIFFLSANIIARAREDSTDVA
jgi:hypothetical protein